MPDNPVETSTEIDEHAEPTAVCARCQCVSTLPELFQRGLMGKLCPACTAKVAVRNAWLIYGSLWALIAVGTILPWLRGEPPWPFSISVGIILAVSLGSLLLHELSHAVVTLLTGGRVFGIHIGIGPLLFQRWPQKFYVGASLLPASGICFAGFPELPWLRARFALMVAAGPLFHLAVLLLLAGRYWPHFGEAGYRLSTVILVVNAFMLITNIFPLTKVNSAAGQVGSDGHMLWRLLRGKFGHDQIIQAYYSAVVAFAYQRGENSEALAAAQEGLQLYPENEILRNLHGYLLFKNQYFDEASAIWRDLALHEPTTESQPALQALHYNNYAWVMLVRSKEENALDIAEEYIERAFRMAPWVPHICGTHAAVLIERGNYAQGIEEALKTAKTFKQLDKSPSGPENQASNLAYAALGYQRSGKPTEARELLTQAMALAPTDLSVQKAAKEITD